MTATSVDHVLLTRFNLPTPGVESLVRAKEGWLVERIALFERYTVPSVAAQSVTDRTWIVYFDPESPQWLLDRIQPHVDAGIFHRVLRTTVTPQDVVQDIREIVGQTADSLLTTNLDNDDGLGNEFLAAIQAHEPARSPTAIYPRAGS